MRKSLALLVGALALTACADDGDHASPDTVIDSQPAAITNAKASFTFHAIGNFSEFLCAFDGEEPAPCISPTEKDLADGNHTFSVAARLLDNFDLTPAAAVWKLDTVAPETTLGAVPPDPDNNATPSIAFTGSDAEGAVTFECAVDGGTAAPCTSPFGLAVADGNHSFTVAAVDAAGNRDATPATYGWNVNTTAPQTTITAGPSENQVTAASVSFAFTSPDAAVTFECSTDGVTFAACISPVALQLGDGAHTFAVRAVGIAGPDPSPANVGWTVDAIAPAVTITVEPAARSNDTTPAFEFTTGEAATFECRIDGVTAFAACASPFEAPSLVDGGKTFRVRATDLVGNLGTDTTFTWVVDTAAPTVTINTQPPALSNNPNPSVTFTPGGSPTKTECSLDGGTFANCASPFTTAVSDGTHTITVRVTDAATNSTSASTSPFKVDTVTPTVTITAEPLADSNDTTPTIQFTTTDSPTSIQCQVDSGTFATCTSPFTTTVTEATHTITVKVSDGVNSSTATTAQFIVDVTAPTVTINTQPAALSNDNTPTVTFTTGGSPTTTECRVDTGTFTACSGSFTPAVAVADGTHTITVHVVDGAGLQASATTSNFTVDTVKPVVTFDDAPPAQWPVNYFDMKFHANETVTFTCSLDGAAFTSCSSPLTITTTYNTASSFSVRATDAANNVQTATTNWTSTDGLVLHYAWEQGGTDNSSLLAQNAAYSPDGDVTTLPFVGGWAGTAAGFGVPLHHYKNTRRVLSSSAQTGNYTVGFWIRTNQDFGAGTLLSTLTATGGFEVSLQGNSLTAKVRETTSGIVFQASATIGMSRWCHVALHATGPGKGLDIFVDGSFAAHVAAPTSTGFENTQSNDLTIGSTTNPIANLDLDDLRFFNRALSDTEMCASLARGFTNPNNGCVPLSPGIELDFENNTLKDTGIWQLPLAQPQLISFLNNTKTGGSMFLNENFPWGPAGGFNGNVNALPGGRSFSIWFVAGANATDLVDFRQQCNANSANQCGIRVSYDPSGKLNVFAGTDANIQASKSVGVTAGRHGIVITEQRTGNVTQTVTVYVDGILKTTLAIGAGNVYANVSDAVHLVPNQNIPIDEFEFWPNDLTSDAEILCENGFDGLFVPADGSCLMTSN